MKGSGNATSPGGTGPIDLSPVGTVPINAFTMDVEEYFQVSGFADVVDRATWDEFESRVEVPTRMVLDLLDEFETKGTFFVLGWIAERHPALVREIGERGHELASHGYEHRLVSDLDAEGFRADLRRASECIHEVSGTTVRGFRAPSFSVTSTTPWAFDVLREEGYLWSSSVFPVSYERYGIEGFARHPIVLEDAQGRSLWEFPMTTWRVLGRNIPAAGGGWLRALPPFVMHRAIRAANREGWPAITYVHPWEFDPDQPRFRSGTRANRFRHYLNLKGTRPRLRRLLQRFPFGTVSQALAALPEVAETDA